MFENFFGFGVMDGDVDGDFFVMVDIEGMDGVVGFVWGYMS